MNLVKRSEGFAIIPVILVIAGIAILLGLILLRYLTSVAPTGEWLDYTKDVAKSKDLFKQGEKLREIVSCPKDSFSLKKKDRLTVPSLIKSVEATSLTSRINPNYVLTELCLLEKPVLDKEVTLRLNYIPSVDFEEVKFTLKVPRGIKVKNNTLEWTENLDIEKLKSKDFVLQPKHWGTYYITFTATGADGIVMRTSSIGFHISPSDVTFGNVSEKFPKNNWNQKYSNEIHYGSDQEYVETFDSDKVKGGFEVSNAPKLDETIKITYQVTPLADFIYYDETTAFLTYPVGLELIEYSMPDFGESKKSTRQLSWVGNLEKGKTIIMEAVFEVTNYGWGSIHGSLSNKLPGSYTKLDGKAADFYLDKNSSTFIYR